MSLLSWLMLSFAAPVTNALAQADEGMMRICSAHGTWWVSTEVSETLNSEDATTASCLCLSLLISFEFASAPASVPSDRYAAQRQCSQFLQAQWYAFVQPRAPPVC